MSHATCTHLESCPIRQWELIKTDEATGVSNDHIGHPELNLLISISELMAVADR